MYLSIKSWPPLDIMSPCSLSDDTFMVERRKVPTPVRSVLSQWLNSASTRINPAAAEKIVCLLIVLVPAGAAKLSACRVSVFSETSSNVVTD